jgi:hypothetical protein
MALALVAKKAVTFAGGTGAPSTIPLTSSWDTTYGSATYTPVEHDLVIVSYATGSGADRSIGVTTAGYTEAAELWANGSTCDTSLSVNYKRMGATPDTTLDLSPTGSAADAGSVIVEVWSGVDQTTALDVAHATATGTATGRPDPPSITPVTSGARIVVVGAAAALNGAVFTQSGSELSNFLSVTQVDNNDSMIGSGDAAWTSGAFDPVAWVGGTTNAGDSWASVSLALRPAPVAHATSGTLTGQIGSVAGTAAHVAKHATSGALSGQIGSVAGSASSASPRPSSGALTGPGSTVAGTAARTRAHASSGALTGPGSSVAGSAARTRVHATSGALPGLQAAIAGDAARAGGVTSHATSGDLAGQGSALSGSAARLRAFGAIGALAGPGSEIAGAAARSGLVVSHDTSGALTGDGALLEGLARLGAWMVVTEPAGAWATEGDGADDWTDASPPAGAWVVIGASGIFDGAIFDPEIFDAVQPAEWLVVSPPTGGWA